MDSSSSYNINGHINSNSFFKKVIRIGDQPPRMLVILHEAVVEELDINEETWLEQIPIPSQGLLLKISKNIGSFNDETEKTRRRKHSKHGIIGEQEK
jgi:hypothetical protein